MNRRLSVVLAALVSTLLALAVILAACGGGAATTTTLAVTTTTAAPTTTTTAAPTTTTTMATTTTTAPTSTTLLENAKVTQYAAAMGVWADAFGKWTDTLVDTGDDVTKLTDADIQTDRAALAQLRTLGDQLHAIQPPAAMAAAHQKVVDALDSVVTLSDKGIAAEASRDQAAYDAAHAEFEKAGIAFATASQEWSTALRLALPSG